MRSIPFLTKTGLREETDWAFRKAMTQPTVSDRPRGAIDAFREVCAKFSELSRTPPEGSVPMWSGMWTQTRYMFRHPVKSYVSIVREGFRAQLRLGTLGAPWFPLEAMADFLSKYSESQLMAIKSLSEINLRRAKSMITENVAFKVGAPIGSAYALLQVSNKLVTVHGSSLDFYRQLMASPFIQTCMGYLLAGFIFMFVIVTVQYLFTIGPTIARSQLLDDILLVALEEKRFAKTITSSLTRDDEPVG